MNAHDSEIQALLVQWDANHLVSCIEMGGLGPGYEQGIQMGIMESLRQYLAIPEAERPTLTPEKHDALDTWLHAAIKHEPKLAGLSGAMAGAIKSIVYKYVVSGVEATLQSMREHDASRIILAKKSVL